MGFLGCFRDFLVGCFLFGFFCLFDGLCCSLEFFFSSTHFDFFQHKIPFCYIQREHVFHLDVNWGHIFGLDSTYPSVLVQHILSRMNNGLHM